jgi:hypothetical protein
MLCGPKKKQRKKGKAKIQPKRPNLANCFAAIAPKNDVPAQPKTINELWPQNETEQKGES